VGKRLEIEDWVDDGNEIFFDDFLVCMWKFTRKGYTDSDALHRPFPFITGLGLPISNTIFFGFFCETISTWWHR
jgi:hypothetical protein